LVIDRVVNSRAGALVGFRFPQPHVLDGIVASELFLHDVVGVVVLKIAGLLLGVFVPKRNEHPMACAGTIRQKLVVE